MNYKKTAAFLLAAAVSVTLASCGSKSAKPSSSASASAAVSASSAAGSDSACSSGGECLSELTLPTAQDLGRDAKKTLSVPLEGTEQATPSTLFIGSNEGKEFSLYIPDSGWKSTGENAWTAEKNKDVEMNVAFHYGMNAEECRTAIVTNEPQYGFEDLKEGTFTGTDGKHDFTMRVFLHQTTDGCWAVSTAFPTEATEGFGAQTAFLAGTFQSVEK